MVLLKVTPATKVALQRYCSARQTEKDDGENQTKLDVLSRLEIGNPIDHADLIAISQLLVRSAKENDEDDLAKESRLETLMKGAEVYQPPPAPKPEPVSRLSFHPGHKSMLICYSDIRI